MPDRQTQDCRRLYDHVLRHPGRRTGDAGLSHGVGAVLAFLLFGHGEGTVAPNVFVIALPDGTAVEPKVEKSCRLACGGGIALLK
jgi:hypothetical protein